MKFHRHLLDTKKHFTSIKVILVCDLVNVDQTNDIGFCTFSFSTYIFNTQNIGKAHAVLVKC